METEKVEAVDGLTVEHVGKLVSVTCKPMAGDHRISAVGVLKGFTYRDGMTVYLEGVPEGIGFPMFYSELTILVGGHVSDDTPDREMPETGIRIEGSELKTVREALCVAQSAISRSYVGNQRAYGQRYAQRLAVLIERIDEARPLGSNGKHDNLHTDVCGCERAGKVEVVDE